MVLAALYVLAFGQSVSKPARIAMLPWTFKDGTDSAVKTANDVITTLLDKSHHEILSTAQVVSVWENDLGQPRVIERIDGDKEMPSFPDAKALLNLGQRLKVDFVCAGQARWHTKSVWVALGPKTKADCTVDVVLIDVSKGEVALEAKGVKSDSTRKESGLETAGALLITMGITGLSGGPKTPHQQRAAQNAIAKAFDPWLKTQMHQKIGG